MHHWADGLWVPHANGTCLIEAIAYGWSGHHGLRRLLSNSLGIRNGSYYAERGPFYDVRHWSQHSDGLYLLLGARVAPIPLRNQQP